MVIAMRMFSCLRLGMLKVGDQLVDLNFFDSKLSRKTTSWDQLVDFFNLFDPN